MTSKEWLGVVSYVGLITVFTLVESEKWLHLLSIPVLIGTFTFIGWVSGRVMRND